jgi:hypothetical protein
VIGSIQELVDFFEAQAVADPELSDELRIEQPGIGQADQARLRAALPLLPDSYLEVAIRISLSGRSIGYIRLTPPGGGGIVSVLIEANQSSANPFLDRLKEEQVIEVGSVEGDPLVVAPGVGEVYLLIHDDPGMPLRPIASSFENLVLLAGNLEQAMFSHEEPNEALEEFEKVLTLLEQKPAAQEWWSEYARMYLS